MVHGLRPLHGLFGYGGLLLVLHWLGLRRERQPGKHLSVGVAPKPGAVPVPGIAPFRVPRVVELGSLLRRLAGEQHLL